MTEDQIARCAENATKIREIYRRIYLGENPHGDFLTSFAGAVVRADAENFTILLLPAMLFIRKYKLQ